MVWEVQARPHIALNQKYAPIFNTSLKASTESRVEGTTDASSGQTTGRKDGRSTVPVVTWNGHVHPTLRVTMARRTPSRVDYPLDIPNGNKAGQVYLYHVPVPELLNTNRKVPQ